MILLDWNQPFKKQLDYFKSKGFILNPGTWDKIASEIHARSFTIAHVASMDILKDVRESMEKAIASGETISQFKKRLPDIMERKGWTGTKAPYRLDNIYRTNLAESYNVGRYTQQMETVKQRPYWRYMAVIDNRTRKAHKAMHGRVYPADSQIWSIMYPPNGFRCRCYVRSLTPTQLKKIGVKVQDDLAFPVDKDGKLYKPDIGWRENVAQLGLDAWMPDFKNYIAAEQKLLKAALSEKQKPAKKQKTEAPKRKPREHIDPNKVRYYDNKGLMREDFEAAGIKITDDEINRLEKAIRMFTASEYEDMRKAYKLLEKSKLPKDLIARYVPLMDDFEQYLDIAPVLKTDSKFIYRGLNSRPDQLLKAGDEIDLGAITSFTDDIKTAEIFARSGGRQRVILRISSDTGYKGTSVTHTSVCGIEESEVVLSGRNVFKIAKITETDNILYYDLELKEIKPLIRKAK